MGLKIEGVSKIYPNTIGGRALALDNVSLEIPTGAFLTLLGPSGCGKSTLLNMIAGLDDPTAGSITLNGRTIYDHVRKIQVPSAGRDISMVFQSYAIWPHMTVRENVEFPIHHGVKRITNTQQRREEARKAVAKVHLEALIDRAAPLLSGGQQQRVSLARALVQKPSLLLLDEPLSNLDATLRESMQKEIRSIVTSEGVTAVYVTHDQREALSMSDVIAVMSEGRIEQIGTPREIYFEPNNRFVADFIGSPNLIEATVESVEPASGRFLADTQLGKLLVKSKATAPVQGDAVTLVLRQQDFEFEPPPNTVNAVNLPVDQRAFFGGQVELVCDIGNQMISVYVDSRVDTLAQKVRVSYAPEHIHYF
ncbi:ABC transporter ATP-binding protein [Ferrovibrio sp.]|uniref:ABC transporter ATP-binding protein n=1 Tax=Ferrovibrio sp. TaxID=1917215 RepID=UPI00351443D7